MKQLFITEVEQSLLSVLDNAQMKALHEALTHALWGKDVVVIDSAEPMPEAQSNQQLLEMFLSAKRVEGCSEKTLHYYQTTIAKLLQTIEKRVVHITTDDLRQYLSDYQQASHCSRGNIDNIRRILSSFFAWLEDENYILKSPVRRIHKIRTNKPVKEKAYPFSGVYKTIKQIKGLAAKATPFSLRWQPLSRRKERSNSIRRTFGDYPVWKCAFIGSANWKLSF